MIYTMDIKGISFSDTAASLLKPPSMIMAAVTIRTIPISQFTFGAPRKRSAIHPERKVDSKFMVILFICPMFPMPKEASTVKTQNNIPDAFRCLCNASSSLLRPADSTWVRPTMLPPNYGA